MIFLSFEHEDEASFFLFLRIKLLNHTIISRYVFSVVYPKMGIYFHRIADKYQVSLIVTGLIWRDGRPRVGVAGDGLRVWPQ